MSRDDDTTLSETLEIPEEGENAIDPIRATSFARLVDGLLEGDRIPPALDAGDRTLLETATIIMASTRDIGIDSRIVDSLIDDALQQNLRSPGLSVLDLTTNISRARNAIPEEIEHERTDVIRMSTRRADRVLRALPWIVASIAVAAAILLFITRPAPSAQVPSSKLSIALVSRPTDSLIGEIPTTQADAASARIDTIYSNRLAAFRELHSRRVSHQGTQHQGTQHQGTQHQGTR